MPVVTLTRPMNINVGGGCFERYGIGQYVFDQSRAFSPYVLAHTANGRPESDDTLLTDPGPPALLLTCPPVSSWRWPDPPPP